MVAIFIIIYTYTYIYIYIYIYIYVYFCLKIDKRMIERIFVIINIKYI